MSSICRDQFNQYCEPIAQAPFIVRVREKEHIRLYQYADEFNVNGLVYDRGINKAEAATVQHYIDNCGYVRAPKKFVPPILDKDSEHYYNRSKIEEKVNEGDRHSLSMFTEVHKSVSRFSSTLNAVTYGSSPQKDFLPFDDADYTENCHLQLPLQKLILSISEYCNLAMNPDLNNSVNIDVLLNVDHHDPYMPHTHGETATFSISEGGTIVYDTESLKPVYQTKNGEFMVMAKFLPHSAAQTTEQTCQQYRTNLIALRR